MQLEGEIQDKGETGGDRQHEKDRRDSMPGQQAVILLLETLEEPVQSGRRILQTAFIFHLNLHIAGNLPKVPPGR